MRAVLAAIVAILAATSDSPADGVDYELILERPQAQTVRVRVQLDDVHEGGVTLSLPTWRPGKYVILDSASHIRWYRAENGHGEALEVLKTDKSTWRIESGGASTVVMEYEVYANDLGNRTMHVDDTHAFLDASAMLMYSPDRRHEPARVHVRAPEGWAIATGLEPTRDDPTRFVAPDYDVLLDSPFEIGIHETIDFEVRGVPHQIVIWGDTEFDADQMIKDFSAIVEAEAAMYGGLAYERYVFMIHARDGAGGATEHLNSTILQTSSTTLDDEDRYKGFLGTVAHELFHTWNVKHSRPAGISPYDYQRENYTTLLWVAEGTTSYYDDLMLVRAGLKEPDDYLKSMAGALRSFSEQPGRHVQSLEQSSFDAWIKFNVPSPDSVNTTVSFYSKGSLVSWMLDMAIRQASEGGASLDDVMRDLFAASDWGGPGFTAAQFQAGAESRAGRDLDEFFDRYVRGTDELDPGVYLDAVGLRLQAKDAGGEDETDDEEEREQDDTADSYLGIDLRSEGSFASVRRVREDGPAFDAGIEVDDEVIALDGRRVTGSNLDDLLEGVEPGATVELTVMRANRLRTISVEASGRDTLEYELKRVEQPTDAQKAAYESWLGVPWPADAEAEIARVLDDWHDAAAKADLDRYASHLADETIFMGTDATEHWDRASFLAFASPYFEGGRAWSFQPRDRTIDVAKGGKVAWFDELLDSEVYGELRGSGVLVREGDDWKIAQYNLSLPIPNDIAKGVVREISAYKATPPEDGKGGS